MANDDIKVGSTVESICSKCKLVLDHLIVSMKEDKIDKVKCNTCETIHKYRDPAKRLKAKTTARKSSGTRTRMIDALKEWEQIIQTSTKDEFVPYAMDKSFKKGDKITHKAFGEGGVLQMVGENKINVLFKEGQKLLICNVKKP